MNIKELPFSLNTDYKLPEDLYLNRCEVYPYLPTIIVPKGTIIKLKETCNFGICILPNGCKDKQGFTISKRIYKL